MSLYVQLLSKALAFQTLTNFKLNIYSGQCIIQPASQQIELLEFCNILEISKTILRRKPQNLEVVEFDFTDVDMKIIKNLYEGICMVVFCFFPGYIKT